MVQVFWDDVLQRTMPTSMGKGGYATGTGGQKISFFTPSGTYTVLDQHNPVLMDSSSYGLPVNGPGGYKEYIAWATRITHRRHLPARTRHHGVGAGAHATPRTAA